MLGKVLISIIHKETFNNKMMINDFFFFFFNKMSNKHDWKIQRKK